MLNDHNWAGAVWPLLVRVAASHFLSDAIGAGASEWLEVVGNGRSVYNWPSGGFMFSIHFDATVSPDRVRLANSRTGQTLDRKCSRAFSSSERLIADRDVASKFLRELILESNSRSWLLRIWATANVSISGDRKNSADKDDVRQLFVEQGFTKVHVA
jgi:hypothetical protein